MTTVGVIPTRNKAAVHDGTTHSRFLDCPVLKETGVQQHLAAHPGTRDLLLRVPDSLSRPASNRGTTATEDPEPWVTAQVLLVEAVADWLRSVRTTIGPDPQSATNIPQFVNAMRSLRAWAGNPTLRELDERAGNGRLPRSSVSLALRRDNRLPHIDLLKEFVKACNANAALPAWVAAWHRLNDAQTAARQAADTA